MNTRRAAHGIAGRILTPALFLLLTGSAERALCQYIPYYGKNKVKYDDFAWRIYKSPHFEIYYYPEFEQHLARLASYAESSYQKVASDLKHEIPFPIPLILYKTHSEFEETNLFPTFVPEGVAAFTEPVRNRMVVPIDEPPDRLQGLITHELTHVFEFNLVPRGLIGRSTPLWIDEGLADYERELWDPLDIMMVRDAAVTEQVPRISRFVDYGGFNPRFVYNLGHCAFEYIAARFGKEGIRQFLYTLRKNTVGGSVDDIYQQAFRLKPEDFDQGFEKWLKERFKPYRDKQRPSDYGRDLSPNAEKTRYTQVIAFAPSPSGEMVAALTANRADGELDVVLLSARDGSVIRNLTSGYTEAYESITLSSNFVAGRSLAFDPNGDTVAFFARKGKGRSLFLVSTLSGEIMKRIPVGLDEAQSPCLLPDGRHALFAALKDGVADIYIADLETGAYTNLTQDAFYDADPQISPDGKQVVYTRRVSGHDKIYVFPLDDPGRKTQLTFGAHDDVAPSYSADGTRIYYASNEDDDIFNLRSLDLRTGVIAQYTDVLGGNMAPQVLAGRGGDRLAFISYFKGDYGLFSLDANEPMKEVDQEVQSAAVGLVDFQPDVVHQVIPENKRRKRLFEKLYLEGRPPLNIAVSTSGDFFGGTQVALTDVLGDQDFLFTFYSIRELRTYEGTYITLGKRFQYGVTAFDRKAFYYSSLFVPQLTYSRQGAYLTQHATGATLIGQYPLSKTRRLEGSFGFFKLLEQYEDPAVEAEVRRQAAAQGVPYPLRDGYLAPLGVRLVQETTRFREFGPLDGGTFSIGAETSPGWGALISSTTFDVDLRKYLRLGSTSSLLALRARGFYSFGDTPNIFYFGGNHELRGYDYLTFSGNKGFFGDVEVRLPVINAMATPIGILGPVRGTLYFGIGGARYKNQPFTFATSDAGTSYVKDPVFGEPVSGFHLVDGRASFGAGLQFFFLGYPMHFDFTKLTDLKVVSDTRFDFWIGFDF
jgi:Tol biopolymer transport system component